MKSLNKNIEVFNQDIKANEGYLYTFTDRLSCRLATQRSTDLILQAGRFVGRKILDVACGDGFFTTRFVENGRPREMFGVDAAQKAVEVARKSTNGHLIRFAVADVHKLPYANNTFDLALVQSVLHHDDDPLGLIKEAFRVAPEVLIHEPNGNNIGLKIIEKTSTYHREHGEKSYSSRKLRRWIKEAGGRVVYQRFGGFVPMFCPDWLARTTKMVEPFLERLPLMRALGCSVFVVVARRSIV